MYSQRNLLRIDLSTKKVSREPVPVEICRKFLGGEGINAWLLWNHFLKVDPKIDALSPDNVLILGVGSLSGTNFGAGSKMKFTYKGPAYNLYGDATVGGGLGSQLRWAGYDHVVITGKAAQPSYIWIRDDTVEIRDARHLWGKDVFTTDALIKGKLQLPAWVFSMFNFLIGFYFFRIFILSLGEFRLGRHDSIDDMLDIWDTLVNVIT